MPIWKDLLTCVIPTMEGSYLSTFYSSPMLFWSVDVNYFSAATLLRVEVKETSAFGMESTTTTRRLSALVIKLTA